MLICFTSVQNKCANYYPDLSCHTGERRSARRVKHPPPPPPNRAPVWQWYGPRRAN